MIVYSIVFPSCGAGLFAHIIRPGKRNRKRNKEVAIKPRSRRRTGAHLDLAWVMHFGEGVSHGLGLSEGLSKLLPIDAQPKHPIVPLCRRGTTDRAAYEPCYPGPSMAMVALDCLRTLLAYVRLLGLDVPLVG